MKTTIRKIKNVEKFKIRQDFDQEREYFSSSHFLAGENILKRTNPATEANISSLIKSKRVSKIMVKSMLR